LQKKEKNRSHQISPKHNMRFVDFTFTAIAPLGFNFQGLFRCWR